MKIVIEVVHARVVDDDVRYLITRAGHSKTGDPMATAKAEVASRFPDLWLRKAIVHSTSWRYDEDTLLLTFLAYSDDLPTEGLPLSLPLRATSDLANDAPKPSSVAAHAIRHLSFLVATEPREFAPKLRPAVMTRLRNVAPDVSRRLGTATAA
jgi:hypothetical protein